MIDNDGAAVECFLKQRVHKRRCYSWRAFVPPAHQWNQTSAPLFGREMEQKGGRHRWRVVGGGLAGLAAPAKQRIRCDGKVSSFHTSAGTLTSDNSETGASSRPYKFTESLLLLFISTPWQQRFAHIRLTISLELGASIKLTERERQTGRKRDRQSNDVLPPMAAEQWASLTFISVIFICWQGRKMQAVLLSGSSCHCCCTIHLYFICSWCFALVLDLESFIHPSI